MFGAGLFDEAFSEVGEASALAGLIVGPGFRGLKSAEVGLGVLAP
ncbi:MAG: hypothetical protein ACKVH0_01600 [Alphaproteobacteria bacterium]